MDKTAFTAMWQAAPRPTAQGVGEPRVVVNLPHRGTPRLLDAVLPLWLKQSVPVAVDVVDTGSSRVEINHLLAAAANSNATARRSAVRVHTLQPRTWKHPSEPIAIACELSQLYAETEYVLFSHVDVFPHSQHLVKWLMEQCSAKHPVVGYEISPRDSVSGWLSENWRGMVGHSLTMVHLPTLRDNGVRWTYNEKELCEFFGWGRSELAGWDTEVTFNLWLRVVDIAVKIVGHDQNREHLVDEWHGHARSYPGSLLFGHKHLEEASRWVDLEVQQAAKRVKQWV